MHFTKMHGLGNDFVVVNAIAKPVNFTQKNIVQLADRHAGVGFDQLLVIEPSKKADFKCLIYNADGLPAEQCGNGLRCVARYLHEEKLISTNTLTVETKAGIFPITIQDYDHIRVTMGVPTILEKLFQIQPKPQHHPHELHMTALTLGNPHGVVRMSTLEGITVDQLGAEIASHDLFPQGANVGFMHIEDDSLLHLRTYERGVGETLACGSNACAAAVAGIVNGWIKNNVDVQFRYGNLSVEWEGEGKPIHLTGPATKVFTGEIKLD